MMNIKNIAKVATKEEAFWLEVVEKAKELVETYEKQLKVNKAMIEIATKKAKDAA